MIKEGDRIPAVTLKQMTAAGPTDVPLADYCAGRKVILFGLVGAFTPPCSASHVPGYVDQAQALRAKGVEAIACVSTSDFFVMDAWGKSLGTGDSVDMLADGNHEFTRAAGLTLDLSSVGLGERIHRSAMVVDDGVITYLAVEPDSNSVTVSSAEAVLAKL
ncbi:MAG: peroxiredoxin [Granulosicoccus sp.]|nr:peroxiredoxin [Granulosicoccus sp.]